MYKILTLNNISVAGLERLPRDKYEVASEIQHPDAILLRSFDMHEMEIPLTLKAVGRAGAGVNNIPVEELSLLGIPVFNTPGANANAVKELVIAGMLLGCRNICQAWNYVRGLEAEGSELKRLVEDGKKRYVGFELPGRTLGVIGLGAIGREVANAALELGMKVVGFDPGITVQGAWRLSSDVEQAENIEALLARSDFITFHVPLSEETRHLINVERLKYMKDGVVVLNFAREGIVDEQAVIEALDAEKVYAYVCDFPSTANKDHPRVVALPHLGASTREAEENCAIMVAEEVRDYLENGNVRHSVNFPEMRMSRTEGSFRLTVANSNVPNMLGQISTELAEAGLNILDMLNKSRNELAYTLVDVDKPVPDEVIRRIGAIQGVLAVRALD